MIKTLELNIYPMTCNHLGEVKYQAAHDGLHLEQVHELIESKRLTDAELAAEMWHADGICVEYWHADRALHMEAWFRMKTIHRFATHPHYDGAES
jgi:hypothetical protein